jgi:hypothetical protein
MLLSNAFLAIRRLVGGVQPGRDRLGHQLAPRSRDRVLAEARVLHFATHGLVAGEIRGLAEPALVLTPLAA